jgi:hypothetical protein
VVGVLVLAHDERPMRAPDEGAGATRALARRVRLDRPHRLDMVPSPDSHVSEPAFSLGTSETMLGDDMARARSGDLRRRVVARRRRGLDSQGRRVASGDEQRLSRLSRAQPGRRADTRRPPAVGGSAANDIRVPECGSRRPAARPRAAPDRTIVSKVSAGTWTCESRRKTFSGLASVRPASHRWSRGDPR